MSGRVTMLLISLLLLFGAMGQAASYQEAPLLAERVAQGELPPLEERLPEVPFVVGPGILIEEENLDWQVGRYGGVLKTTHVVPEWNPYVFCMINEPALSAPRVGVSNIIGGVFEDYEVNEDNTVFTFHLRRGLRWSDGEYVTTSDVLFAYEDVMKNEEINPIFPGKYRAGGRATGEPMTLEVLDEYTFQISFDEPYGNFLTEITIKGWVAYTDLIKPRHHLEQYHIRYTTLEELRPELDEQELDDEWYRLFLAKDAPNWDLTRDKSIGFPSLYPWIRVPSAEGILRFERNPYYFKVDVDGNQLPYIDYIESYEVGNHELMTMMAITGEANYLAGAGLDRMAFYQEHREEGGYTIHSLVNHVDPVTLFFNLTYEDDVWREVVGDVRFRKAVSLAIDRDELMENLYFGMAYPSSVIPSEFDPARAEALLDEMGLDARDAEGYRIGPDGETFDITIEVARREQIPEVLLATELLVEHLQNVGLAASMRQIGEQLHGQRMAANELMTTILWIHRPGWSDSITDDYLPQSAWGRAWQLWYNTGGESGEEPPQWVKDLYDIHEEIIRTVPHFPEGIAAIDALFDWYYENVPYVLIVEDATDLLITPRNLRNVAHDGIALAAVFAAEQYYFAD